MGFGMRARSLARRWALTPPFHPYPFGRCIFCATFRESLRAVVNGHPALWSPDFPLPCSGSDHPTHSGPIRLASFRFPLSLQKRVSVCALDHHSSTLHSLVVNLYPNMPDPNPPLAVGTAGSIKTRWHGRPVLRRRDTARPTQCSRPPTAGGPNTGCRGHPCHRVVAKRCAAQIFASSHCGCRGRSPCRPPRR